jgi:hypothetical protein
MDPRTIELMARIDRLGERAQALGAIADGSPPARRLQRRLSTATTGVDTSYRAACTAGSRDVFIVHISAAARHAKRARQILQDLTHRGYARIETTRDLILEARGIEAILTASRRTAKRRRQGRRARA